MLETLLIVCIILSIIQFTISLCLSGMLYMLLLERRILRDQPDKASSVDKRDYERPILDMPQNGVAQFNPVKKSEVRSTTQKVEDLPPDVIAPFLRKPPKPAGGFGSKVEQ